MKRLIPAIGLAASACILAGPAFAHAHLKTAKPTIDGTVATAPMEITLEFSEGVNLKFTGVTVTTADGTAVQTGFSAFGPGGDATLVTPVLKPLAAGHYDVEWHALATDGHKTSGHYGFTVRP